MAAISVPNNTYPQVLRTIRVPAAPNPIVESQVMQSFSLLPRNPILVLETSAIHAALNPPMLQFGWMWASVPTRVFHVSRPSVVLRYCSSAINECKERAVLFIAMKFIGCPIFIPRQILVKGVFQ